MKRIIVFVLVAVSFLHLFANEEIVNLREVIEAHGLMVGDFVDGGVAKTNYHADYPPSNAFDGICTCENTTENDSLRWLGEINLTNSTEAVGTYLKLMLPYGSSFKIESYKLWRLSTGGETYFRTPISWRFYGITAEGDEILLSEESDNKSLLSKDNITIAVTQETDRKFIGIKFVPTKSEGCQQNWLYWDVGLMELEIFVKDVFIPTNLRKFIVDMGLNITNHVDGGRGTANRWDGGQYLSSYPPVNAFDGICDIEKNDSLRWLGEIGNNTYLKLMLPKGYTCGVVSYTLWKYPGSSQLYAQRRTPITWEFYGITSTNKPAVLLSAVTNCVDFVSKFSQTINITNDMSFIGFQWIPKDSKARNDYMTTGKDRTDWDVGLSEFEIMVKDIKQTPKGTVIIIR